MNITAPIFSTRLYSVEPWGDRLLRDLHALTVALVRFHLGYFALVGSAFLFFFAALALLISVGTLISAPQQWPGALSAGSLSALLLYSRRARGFFWVFCGVAVVWCLALTFPLYALLGSDYRAPGLLSGALLLTAYLLPPLLVALLVDRWQSRPRGA